MQLYIHICAIDDCTCLLRSSTQFDTYVLINWGLSVISNNLCFYLEKFYANRGGEIRGQAWMSGMKLLYGAPWGKWWRQMNRLA